MKGRRKMELLTILGVTMLSLLDSLLISGITHSLSLDESGPRFLEEWPSSYTFSSRLGGSLRCVVHGQPHPHLEWVDNDGFAPLSNVSQLREISGDSVSIRFFPFNPDKFMPTVHMNGYRCRATNPSGAILSPSVYVRAVLDTPFKVENKDVSVVKGNTAVLRCQVPDEFAEFVSVTSWVEGASAVNIYPNFQTGKWLMVPTGELYIFNVDHPDSQKSFSCRILHKLTNEAKTSSPAKVLVKEPEGPMVVRMVERESSSSSVGSSQIRVRAGEEVFLSCLARGNPPPSYTWYKEREDGTGVDIIRGPNRQSPVLQLNQVRSDDSGVYRCKANNSHSFDEASITVTLYVPLRAQVSPNNQIVDVGRGTTLGCLVSGGPILTLQWFKDGVALNPSGVPSRYSIGPRESLKLPSVHPEDAGMYQCMATNDLYAAQDSAQVRIGSVLPELVYRFSEQTIQPGPSVSLKCTAVGNPPPQFTWTLDGFPLPESDRFLVGQYVTIHDNVISHVNITNAREEDGGFYSCQARNAMGSVIHSARLNIYGPPFVRQVPVIKAVAGKRLHIQCPVSGYPIEVISWERGGSQLPVTRQQRVYPNGSLIIDHVQKSDEGVLTCHAKGRLPTLTSSRDLHIRVVVPPKIMPFQFMNSVLREGMRAAVSCILLEGDRPIDLVWEFQGRPITSSTSNGITIRIPDEYSSTLVIESLSSNHNGKYTCTAENQAGREHHSSELTVQVPPKWSVEPRDINVSAGQSLSLHCKAQGHPTPSITWKRGLGNLQPGEYKDFTGPLLSNGTIRFDPIRKMDEGSYLCEARNGVGSGLSKLVFIKVNAPAQFVEREQHISARVGERAILQCKVKGDTPIQVQWSSNKHGPIGTHTNHRYIMREQELETSGGLLAELIVSSVERGDGGVYICKGSNAFGQDHTSITITVQEPPQQPSAVRVMEISSRSISLSWMENFNGNSPLINYIIQSKFPSETWTEAEVEELTVPASQTTAVVEALTPSTTYHIRVLAQNGVGFSQPSEVIQITTTEEAPEGPPLEVFVEAMTSTSLRIQWAPPEREMWHGTILGYYLGFRELSLALAEEVGTLFGEGATVSHSPPPLLPQAPQKPHDMHGYHFKTVEVGSDFGGETYVENLRKFTRYGIVIQAFNGKGVGPSSSPVIGTTLQDVPSSPPQKVECMAAGTTSLKVLWDPPPIEGRHGVIQGYAVDLEWEGSGSARKTTGDRELVLHGLKKWTNYSVSVRAFTSVGEGMGSGPSQICTTDEDIPSPPADTKVVISSRRSLLVSWLPPGSPNGHIVKYVVHMKLADGNKVEKKVAAAVDTSLELVGLKEGQAYEVWVSAITKVGEGPGTTKIKATPTNKVGAQIGSFSGEVEIAWKRELVLECLAVGLPEPNVHWAFNGNQIHSGSGRKEVEQGLRNKLTLRDVSQEDAGNYSCYAQNNHGSDSITYALKVLVPPQPPVLQVLETTHTSLHLTWTTPPNGGSEIRGYVVNYRREDGEWDEIAVGVKEGSHNLQGLQCGSTYQLFISAYNKIGSGLPSDIITRTTKGQVPVSPQRDEAIQSNYTSVVVKLGGWNSQGCPIQKFLIEYKPAAEKSWMRIPSELNGEAKFYTLTGLHWGTRYEIRVTARNSAGETVAKYDLLTQSAAVAINGAASGETREQEAEDGVWSTSLFIIFPSLLSLATVTALIVFVFYVRRKRMTGGLHGGPKTVLGGDDLFIGGGMMGGGTLPSRYQHQPHPSSYLTPDPHHQQQLMEAGHFTLKKHQPDLTANATTKAMRTSSGSGEYADEVSPYATFQLPENPPNRPLLTKGMMIGMTGSGQQLHTGDTLYNVGNVYSGPYHAVQSQPPQNYMYSDATLLLRDAEYMRLPAGRVQEDDSIADSEVKKILGTLRHQHHQQRHDNYSPEYELEGEEDMTYAHALHLSQQYSHCPTLPYNSSLHQVAVGSRVPQSNAAVRLQGYKTRNRSDLKSSTSGSSTEYDESSPTTGNGRGGGGGGRKSKSSTSGSSSAAGLTTTGAKGGMRLRSSSGYSSHTEETSFTHNNSSLSSIVPTSGLPPRFADSVLGGTSGANGSSDLGVGDEGMEGEEMYVHRREKRLNSHSHHHHHHQLPHHQQTGSLRPKNGGSTPGGKYVSGSGSGSYHHIDV